MVGEVEVCIVVVTKVVVVNVIVLYRVEVAVVVGKETPTIPRGKPYVYVYVTIERRSVVCPTAIDLEIT